MTLRRPAILSLLLAVPALTLQAQAADPLWNQALAHLHGVANLVAGEVRTHLEILDGDGRNQDTLDKVTRLDGWKDGEPTRAVVSYKETQKTALAKEELDPHVANHPDGALAEVLSAQRQGEALLDGKPCVRFKVTGKKRGKVPFTGTVWVETATGLPQKAEFILDASAIPMTKSASSSLSFTRTADGHWVPRAMTIDSLMSVMFMKVRMTSQVTFEAWTARP